MEGPGLRSLYRRIRKFNGDHGTVYIHGSVFTGNIELIPYGKRLYIRIGNRYVMVFFGMAGTVSFRKNMDLEPSPVIKSERNGYAYFFRCTARILSPGEFEEIYEPEIDPLDPAWNPERVFSLIADQRNNGRIASDLLLDQRVMCGPGNIIKNEVLWRCRINPEEKISEMGGERIREMVGEVALFSRIFFEARTQRRKRKNWLGVYGRKTCPRCFGGISRKSIGETDRITYWCPDCQRSGDLRVPR